MFFSTHPNLPKVKSPRKSTVAFVAALFCAVLVSALPVKAATTLTVTPITWNVVGLDSNDPAAGPYRFPVGARVCSSVATTNVAVNWVWDSANANLNLRPGSLNSITFPSIAAGACADAYFEVEVTRVLAAYGTTRRYHITATDTSGTVSTPTPRELYVERLISQNRNGITDVKLNGVSIPAGGTMTLLVGNTYTIELDGFTATQGYNQLESFINLSNTVFQVLSVTSTYSADSNMTHVPNPSDKLYADACLWDSYIGSPTYRSCIGGDDKAGGTVRNVYTVKIIGGAGSSEMLSTLLHDFSGSSYHYNADMTSAARIARILGPSSVTIQKTFLPKAIAPGGTATMTLKLTNPASESMPGVNFADTFPSGMVVAGTPGVTYSGCGAGAFSPGLVGGETAISFANGTLAPNSVCTITVKVTAPAGTFPNTTGHLFINTSVDTGNTGSDTLTASNAPACTTQALATWTVPNGTTANPPDLAGGVPTRKSVNVGPATATDHIPASSSIDTTQGVTDTTSWKTYGYKSAGQYVEFVVDTSKFSGVTLSFYVANPTPANGPTSIVLAYDNGTGLTNLLTITNPAAAFTQHTVDFAGLTSTTGNTTFRLTGIGANNDNISGGLNYDLITFTSCQSPLPAPTISKSFAPNPVRKGSTTTLTFTLNNTATGNDVLTDVAFTDVLPAGLSVASGTSAACGGTLTTTAATRTIALTGGTLAAGGTCTFGVTVTGTTEGQYDNITGPISSKETGSTTNYATASVTVVAPPVLAKAFSPTGIFTGDTSTLSFVITNPNRSSPLSGLSFSDSLPAGLTAPNSTTSSLCGSGSLVITGGNLLTFSGGSLAALGSCTFTVTVTGTTEGTKNNTTGIVTSTEGGNGNTASASLVVNDRNPSVDLTKQISTTSTGPWTAFVRVNVGTPVYYRFKVYNSGDVALNPISVTDPTLLGLGLSPASCAWLSGSGTPFVFPLTPGDTAYCVLGPTNAVAGTHTNTATAHGTYNGTVHDSRTSTATYATSGLLLAKSVQEPSFSNGSTLHYGYLVTNNGAGSLPGPVSVGDDKTTVTCPPVNTVGNFDNSLDSGESITCTASYVTTGADTAAKYVTNVAMATVNGVNSNTASRTVSYQSTTAVVMTGLTANSASTASLWLVVTGIFSAAGAGWRVCRKRREGAA